MLSELDPSEEGQRFSREHMYLDGNAYILETAMCHQAALQSLTDGS